MIIHADIADKVLSVPHGVGFCLATMIWEACIGPLLAKVRYDSDIYYGTGGTIWQQLVMDGFRN
jgi:hypothetical protein